MDQLLENRTQFLNFLRKRMRHPEDAEEVLQEAFLRGLEKSSEVRDQEKIVAWFYRVLRNCVVDYYRKAGKNVAELGGALQDLEGSALAASESQNEACNCLNPLLGDLKPEYREALTTVDLEGGSLGDLANRAAITENNAAVRLHRARQAMRELVRQSCGACAEHRCFDCDCKRTS